MEKYLEFVLGNQEYAISVDNICSVSRLHKIVRMPQTPNFVLGITNYKEQITTVIDLKCLLEIPKVHMDKCQFAINAYKGNSFYALLADNVLGVIDVDLNNVRRIKALDFEFIMIRK